MEKVFTVYILTNYSQTSFYIGVTNDIKRRMYEHKNKLVEGFTEKYNIDILVYFENIDSPEVAIEREKQLKRWHRNWKINLVRKFNLEFKDLSLNWE